VPGEIEVAAERITQVVHRPQAAPRGARVIDGHGATLMPKLCAAHTHFSWNRQPSLAAIQILPVEELTLWCAQVAARFLDRGFTSCSGAAAAKPRLDVVIRNAINTGLIPGPRYPANRQESATVGGRGVVSPPHIEHEMQNFGAAVSGPQQIRRMVRRCIKFGVELITLNLSGEGITGAPSAATGMREEGYAMAADKAHFRGLRVRAHARSDAAVQMCLLHGIETIYHASFIDDTTSAALAERRDRHFVASALAWLICTAQEATPWGALPGSPLADAYEAELAAAVAGPKAMFRHGTRVLPSGDYGFAWTPHGRNARHRRTSLTCSA
jgi:imidazolonepropionase-like amidohydrolase